MILDFKSTDSPSKNLQGTFRINDHSCLPLLGGVPRNSIQNFRMELMGKDLF